MAPTSHLRYLLYFNVKRASERSEIFGIRREGTKVGCVFPMIVVCIFLLHVESRRPSGRACEWGLISDFQIFKSLIFVVFFDRCFNFSFLSGFHHVKIAFLSVDFHRTEPFDPNPDKKDKSTRGSKNTPKIKLLKVRLKRESIPLDKASFTSFSGYKKLTPSP